MVFFNIQQPLIFNIFFAGIYRKKDAPSALLPIGAVKVFFLIKRRVKINQIHAIGVYPTQYLQIIVAKDGAVFYRIVI